MAARIDELMAAHSGDAPWVAFEYYPPRTEDGVNNLKKKMPRFKAQSECLSPRHGLRRSAQAAH